MTSPDDSETEVWLPLPDYEGLYEVSHLGRVRSLHKRFAAPRLCAQGDDGTGYRMVSLSRDGRRTAKTVHRLVCRAFHGEPNALQNEAAHLDGNKTNNRASNLKWSSKVENHYHKRFHGTHQAGERHPRAKLTEATARLALSRLAEGDTCQAIADSLGVSRSTIEDIRKRKKWRHIKGPPDAYATPARPRSTGNGQYGSSNHAAKLTEEQAAEIRARTAAGEGCTTLGKEYGVSRATANRIGRGLSYGRTASHR